MPRSVAVYQLDGPLNSELVADGLAYFLTQWLNKPIHRGGFWWREYTLMGKPAVELRKLVEQQLEERHSYTFLRAMYIRQPGQDHYLLLSVPSLEWDTSSWMLLARHLSKIYAALLQGMEPAPPSPMETPAVSAADLATDKLFWHKQTQLLDQSNLAFPTRRNSAFEPAFHTVAMGEQHAKYVRRLSIQLGLELESVLVALWQVYWAGRMGYLRTATCLIVDGRAHCGWDRMGNYSRCLPVVFRFDELSPLEDVIYRLSAQLKVIHGHTREALPQLTEKVPVAFELARGSTAGRARDMRVALLETYHWLRAWHLKVSVWPEGPNYILRYHYDHGKLNEADIHDWHQGFLAFIASAHADPRRAWSKCNFVGDDERQLLNQQGLITDMPVPLPLHRAVAHWAKATPDAVAIAGKQRCTYGDLWRRSQLWGAWLQTLTLSPGTVVMLSCRELKESMAAMIGCWENGLTVLPLPTSMPSNEKVMIAASCRVRAVIADPAVLETFPLNLPQLTPGQVNNQGIAKQANPQIRMDLTAPALVLPLRHLPKPELISVNHRQLRYGIAGMVAGLNLDEHRRFASPLALCLIPGQSLLFVSLALGATYSGVGDTALSLDVEQVAPACRMVMAEDLPDQQGRIGSATRQWIILMKDLTPSEHGRRQLKSAATVFGWWSHPALAQAGLWTKDGVGWHLCKGLQALILNPCLTMQGTGSQGDCWLAGPCVGRSFADASSLLQPKPDHDEAEAPPLWMLATQQRARMILDTLTFEPATECNLDSDRP